MSLRPGMRAAAVAIVVVLAGLLTATATPALAETNPHQVLSTSKLGVVNAKVEMDRYENQKLFSITAWRDGANQWYEVIDSQGAHHSYYFDQVPGAYKIWYYIGSWRLCDGYSGYCTGYLAIGA